MSVRKDGLEKVLSFSKYRVGLSFKEGRLSDLCVTSKGKVQYAEEYSEAAAAPGAVKK